MRKEAPGKAWHPIEGLPDDAHTWRNEPYDRAREEWREVKAALARRGTDRYALEQWLREQRRAFAIENGQIEQLYTLRRGGDRATHRGRTGVRARRPYGRRRPGRRDPARAADGPGGRTGDDLCAGERREAPRTFQPEGDAPPAHPAPGGRAGDRRTGEEGAGRSPARRVQAPAQQPAPRGRAHPRILPARAGAFGNGPTVRDVRGVQGEAAADRGARRMAAPPLCADPPLPGRERAHRPAADGLRVRPQPRVRADHHRGGEADVPGHDAGRRPGDRGCAKTRELLRQKEHGPDGSRDSARPRDPAGKGRRAEGERARTNEEERTAGVHRPGRQRRRRRRRAAPGGERGRRAGPGDHRREAAGRRRRRGKGGRPRVGGAARPGAETPEAR